MLEQKFESTHIPENKIVLSTYLVNHTLFDLFIPAKL